MRATHKELQGNRPSGILFVLIQPGQTGAYTERIEERTCVEMPVRISDVEFAGWCEGVFAVLCNGFIWRQEARANNNAMKRPEHDEPFDKFAASAHFASLLVRILGSAQ